MVKSAPTDQAGKDTARMRPCAICKKPAVAAFRPFCSKRCADIDLHRWLAGTYVVPAKPAEDEDDELGAPGPTRD